MTPFNANAPLRYWETRFRRSRIAALRRQEAWRERGCMAWLDTAHLFLVALNMKIRNVVHKGLRRFIEQDDASGLQPAVVSKIGRMVTFLQDMEGEDELRTVPSWKAHLLTGGRKGTWSLFVTKNWRLTFRIDQDEIEIIDLDYEDYH
jgi:proteic killer suppression protein